MGNSGEILTFATPACHCFSAAAEISCNAKPTASVNIKKRVDIDNSLSCSRKGAVIAEQEKPTRHSLRSLRLREILSELLRVLINNFSTDDSRPNRHRIKLIRGRVEEVPIKNY